MKFQVGEMESWWNGKLMKWQVNELANWLNSKLIKWQVYEMASWCNDVALCNGFKEKHFVKIYFIWIYEQWTML